ncbi:MAG: hypothetical protein J5I81_11235 [Nitrococcus mobilis]|nr:hypothetical protein [Nitrococcus mobilis]
MSKNMILLIVVLALAEFAWLGRWEIVPAGQKIAAYQLDRWTGDVKLLGGNRRFNVKDSER